MQCQFSFIYFDNFSTNQSVITQLLKMSLTMRKIWGSIPRPVESASHCSQRLAIAATCLQSFVAQALNRGVGPRHSLPRFGAEAEAQPLLRVVPGGNNMVMLANEALAVFFFFFFFFLESDTTTQDTEKSGKGQA